MEDETNFQRQQDVLNQGEESDEKPNWILWALIIFGIVIIGLSVYFFFFYGADASAEINSGLNESFSAGEENIILNENPNPDVLIPFEENISG